MARFNTEKLVAGLKAHRLSPPQAIQFCLNALSEARQPQLVHRLQCHYLVPGRLSDALRHRIAKLKPRSGKHEQELVHYYRTWIRQAYEDRNQRVFYCLDGIRVVPPRCPAVIKTVQHVACYLNA